MAQKSITTPRLYDELLSRLDHIRQEYQRIDQGYRLSLYQLMGDAMSTALAIEADHENKDQFLESIGQKSDVVYAAMIFISEAKSEGARKKASKGARALRYLVEQLKVPLHKIPEAIREHGGVEKLSRLAAQGQPRRKPSASKAEDEGQGGAAAEGQGRQDKPDADDREQEGSVAMVEPQIQFGLSPEVLAKLVRFADNTAIQISGFVRAPAGMRPSIEVQDVTDVIEDESDWLD
jgi:hypothetical protein